MCRGWVLFAVTGLVFSAGCGGKSATKFDTPEAAYKAFQEAAKNEDWQSAAMCLTEESQTMMAEMFVLGATFSTGGDPNKEKELNQLLKSHGIDLDADPGPAAKNGPAFGNLSANVKDKPAFIGELMAWLKKNETGGGGMPDFAAQKLGKVTVNGDHATSMVGTERGDQPIEFRRVDGGWLISLPEAGGSRGPSGGPTGPEIDLDDIPAVPPPDNSDQSKNPAAGDNGADNSGSATTNPDEVRGTLRVRDKTHALRHAVAYKTKFFDDPCTAVLLTEQPLSQSDLSELRGLLEREGHDRGFFASGVYLRLLFDQSMQPHYLFAWADNVSISNNSTIDAKVNKREGRIAGRAASKKDDRSTDELRFGFEVEFNAALLPIREQAVEARVIPDSEPAVEVGLGQPVETLGQSESSETPIADAPAPVKETQAEAGVTVDEAPREPATVAEAIKLLDLRTFPVMDGAMIPDERRQVGQLSYQRNADLAETFEFQRKHLKSLGWKELPGADESLARNNPQALYTRDGFLVSMSVGMFVSIVNHGNVITSKLPVPAGVQPHYSDLRQASYVTTADADETRQVCRKLLSDLGWKPYGQAGDTMYWKQNAVKLSARVSVHDARPGKTFIDYSTKLLSADLPVPGDVKDPRYTDGMKTLYFDHPGNAVKELAAFYNTELARQSFQATSEPIGDKEVAVVYRNDEKDMITLDMKLFNDLTRVNVRHYTAAEVAEMDRKLKQDAAKREAERRLAAEDERRGEAEAAKVAAEAFRQLDSETSKLAADAVRQLDPQAAKLATDALRQFETEAKRAAVAAKNQQTLKVAIPIPGKAKKVEQDDPESLEITVALGGGKPIFEALRKHFQAQGWREDEAEFDDGDGRLRISKGDASLRIDYSDWISAGEIDVDGDNVTLEPQRGIAAFAALGGVAPAAPPPAALLAKAPLDIPVPADARELKVRSGANIGYEVAADIKQLAAYFRTAMARHGWSYDAKFSEMDDDSALLSFKKGRAPCGISLTNTFGGDFTSVTIAGGGMNWSRLRGARATADPPVAAAATTPVPASSKARSAAPPTKVQPKSATQRSR